MSFQGYIVERISEDGKLEVFIRSFDSNLLHIFETKLPMILEIPKCERRGKELKKEDLDVYVLSAVVGKRRYRYLARRVIPSGFAFVVLFPKGYDYTNYEVNLPKDTTHHKKVRKSPTTSFEYVIADRFEDRFHIGPNFNLLYNRWAQYLTKAICYANPTEKAVTLTLSIDLAPVEGRTREREVVSITESAKVTESAKERDPFQDVVDRAHRDRMEMDKDVKKERVKSISSLDGLLHLIVKDTEVLLKALKRIGIKVERGGKHQYKARNPRTGKSAPISRRREFFPGDIRKICRELGISYDELLSHM